MGSPSLSFFVLHSPTYALSRAKEKRNIEQETGARNNSAYCQNMTTCPHLHIANFQVLMIQSLLPFLLTVALVSFAVHLFYFKNSKLLDNTAFVIMGRFVLVAQW